MLNILVSCLEDFKLGFLFSETRIIAFKYTEKFKILLFLSYLWQKHWQCWFKCWAIQDLWSMVFLWDRGDVTRTKHLWPIRSRSYLQGQAGSDVDSLWCSMGITIFTNITYSWLCIVSTSAVEFWMLLLIKQVWALSPFQMLATIVLMTIHMQSR